MNFKILLSALVLSTSALAGQGSGTGARPIGADSPTTGFSNSEPKLQLNEKYRSMSPEELIKEIRITSEDMKTAIEAALGDESVPLDTAEGRVTIKPQSLDFKNKTLHGKDVESGASVILREVQSQRNTRTLRQAQ